jgi:histidinol-phosphate aminotransferase
MASSSSPAPFRRRDFIAGLTAGAAALGWRSSTGHAQSPAAGAAGGGAPAPIVNNDISADAFDAQIKLCFNENPYGPSEATLDAIKHACRYANRYGYPDGGITRAIAEYHDASPANILLAAGSTEILSIVAQAFLGDRQRVLGVAPTFGSVYQFATGLDADSIQLPLRPDYGQDIPAMIAAARKPGANIGFVYLCNPNNPTGVVVGKQDVNELLDGLPSDLPVLIDEAYHDFVDDSAYETAIPHVLAGRPVIVARTFSKAYGMAGVRLGYAVATPAMIDRLNSHAGDMSVSALAKWAGAAALADRKTYDFVRGETLKLRGETTAELRQLGYESLPSGGNFFMVDLKTSVGPVISAFRDRGILVGRPFPPMLEHLRVTVGARDEMAKFVAAFREIMPANS